MGKKPDYPCTLLSDFRGKLLYPMNHGSLIPIYDNCFILEGFSCWDLLRNIPICYFCAQWVFLPVRDILNAENLPAIPRFYFQSGCFLVTSNVSQWISLIIVACCETGSSVFLTLSRNWTSYDFAFNSCFRPVAGWRPCLWFHRYLGPRLIADVLH